MNDGGWSAGDGFAEYEPSTNATSPPLYSFVIVYSVLSFILVPPLVIWANIYERKQKEALSKAAAYNEEAEFTPYDPAQDEGEDHPQDIVFPIPETNGDTEEPTPTSPISSKQEQSQSIFRAPSKPSADPLAVRPDTPTAAPTNSEATPSPAQQRKRNRGVGGIFRELDRVTQGYPDNDPDFMTVVSGSQANNSRNPRLRTDQSFAQSQAQSQGQNSNAPSAATTSQLYRSQHRPRSQIWDVSARRWKARRPIGRVNVIQRAIQVETESVGASETGEQRTPLRPMRRAGSSRATVSRAGGAARAPGSVSRSGASRSGASRSGASRSGASRSGASRSGASRSVASRGGASRSGMSRSGMSRSGMSRSGDSRTYASGSRAPSLASSRQPSSRGTMSETASTRVQQNDGPPLIVSNVPRPSRPPPPVRPRHLRGTSVSSFATSGYATTVDDVEPDDAADAHDPGRRNSFDEVQDPELTVCCGAGALWRPRTICMISDGLIELAEPDPEMQRIVSIGLPLTIGAMSQKFFQAIMVAFISIFIGTESMVAYVLVILLMGFTNELTGAVADAQSSLCSYALATGQNFLAGQYLQIALIWHTILSVPVLAIWATQMGPAVTWLVEDEDVGDLARQYTQVIVVLYFIQATSRIFSVLFQLTGNELFETRFMLIEGIVNVVLVSCVISLKPSRLETVAWIELLVGFAATMIKMFIAICKGWFWPFWPGMSSFSYSTISELRTMIVMTIPLILGAFLEYGEWEVLLFFITHLGPAEVATWGILGIIWKLLETATEGVGEAASIRVAYHLGNGNPELAKLASYKSLFVAAIQALILTSTLLMSGKNISAWLTNDPTLQNMLNEVITYLGLGNLVMTYAMITWSLVGAQGRYRLATLTILWSRWLVTIPMALVVIFGFRLDLRSVMCCIIVGFATAGLTLAYVLFRSDWSRLSKILQELNALVEEEDDEDDEDDSYDDEDDDSTGIDY